VGSVEGEVTVSFPPFSEAEFWNTALWAPLGQELFTLLKKKALRDRSVFDRVVQAAAANAKLAGVSVDRPRLHSLLLRDEILQAVVARDLVELDTALGSVVRPLAGWTVEQTRTVLVAVLLLAIDEELPADRQLDFAAHRAVIGRLNDLQLRLGRLNLHSEEGIDLLRGLDARVSRLLEEISRLPHTVSATPSQHIVPFEDGAPEMHESLHGVGAKHVSYSRVLLPDSALVFRALRDSEGNSLHMSDGSILQFMVEELIRLGVIDIAINWRSQLSRVVDSLPDTFRRRIVLVDVEDACTAKSRALMLPIFEEFGVEADNDLIRYSHSPSLSDRLALSIINLTEGLRTFLVGLDYQLQVDVQVGHMQEDIRKILTVSRDPLSRASLTTLEGILNTYEPQTIDGIALKSTAPNRLIAVFDDLVHDGSYRQFSSNTKALGRPQQLAFYIRRVRDAARNVLVSPNLKSLVKPGQRVLLASGHLPEVESELYEDILQTRYLPTVVSLREPVQRAKKTWRSIRPPFLPPWPTSSDDDLEGLQDDWDAADPFEKS
jgi:hypothetical protein